MIELKIRLYRKKLDKDLYNISNKTMIKVKEDTQRQNEIPCSRLGELTVEMSTDLSSLQIQCHSSSSELGKQLWNSQANTKDTKELVQKNKARGTIIFDFKKYCRAMVSKTARDWYNLHTDINGKHRNKTTHVCRRILDKVVQNIHWRKGSLLERWPWKNWVATCRKMKHDSHLSPHIVINSK